MMSEKKIPFRVKVVSIKSGRYLPSSKPISWDERRSGSDIIVGEDGHEYPLISQGDQSTPGKGWELLINGKENGSYTWTLYGISKA